MYKTLRNGVVICLLVAAAAGTWYLGRTTAPPQAEVVRASAMPLGYYLRDAVVLGTDDEGRLAYRINAQLAEERPRDGALLLKGVELEYQPEQEIPWRISADTAEAERGSDYLELQGNVTLERTGDAKRTLVETERLHVAPERHTATADGEVRFTVGGSTLTADGLKAFLKDDRLEFGSNVSGQFLP